jgi:sugar phosphate isomerase/epimerase
MLVHFIFDGTNLAYLCDVAASKTPPCRIAYEPWCWGAHVNTWQQGWEAIKRVNRPNIGINLDTFQVPGQEWADPASEDGLIHGYSQRELTEKFEASMESLAETIPSDKTFYIQISDGLKMDPPIQRDHPAYEKDRPARCQWSHTYRPLPFENGYLPWMTALRACRKTGFRGWSSMEIFEERQMKEDPNIPEEYVVKVMEAWKKSSQN